LKLRTAVFVLMIFLSLIPTTIAEDDPPGPPPIPPYIKHTLVTPNWTYYDGMLIFWCLYIDESNSTITSAKIHIEENSYDLYENSSSEYPTEKNFYYYNDFKFPERRTYDFYFEIDSAIAYGTFDIVNRPPYMLETPPTKMKVYEEFEWEGRAHDPDLDYLTWTWDSNITRSEEWEFQPNNTTMKLKIKCEESFVGWVNVSVFDNYTGMDYWNWTLICYGIGQERLPPPIPRGAKGPFRLGDNPPSTQADEMPETLATANFVPSGDGHEIDWTPKGGGNNYVEVDDPVGAPDDDGTYVSIAKGNQEDYYDVPDHTTETGTITNVRVVVRAKQTGAEDMNICIYTVLTEYCGGGEGIGAGYGDETEDWVNNPNTGIAWTWAQIDAIQIGMKSDAVGGWGGTMYVTQVYAIVTYTPPPMTVYYWTGLGGDGLWDTALNWEPNTDYPKDNDDRAYLDGADVITLQDGVAASVTVGELILNNTYAGTLTMNVDLIIDDAGSKNGKLTIGGGTINSGVGNKGINIDGDWLNSGGTYTANSARVTFQGGQTQSVTSNGDAFYQVTVDNVASTVMTIKDNIQMLDLTILAAGEYEMDSVTEGPLTHKFNDAANCGFISSSSGTLTLTGNGFVNFPTMTTAAAGAPTNYWINDMSNIAVTLDYATIKYHTQAWATSHTGAIDIEQTTYDNSKGAGQYSVSLRTATVTKFSDNTISNSGAIGLYVASQDVTNIVNLVVTASTSSDLVDVGRVVELVDSNFDKTKVLVQTTNGVVSRNHNDKTDHYIIFPLSLAWSDLATAPVSTSDVEVYSSGGTFTIDQDMVCSNFWLQTNAVVVHNTLITLTITGGSNFTVNGSLDSDGFITSAGYYTFFVNYDGQVWLNGSDVDQADPVISFPYTTAASNYGHLNELNLTQPAGADNVINITQRDFSVKGSGTVITFFSNNTVSVTSGYIVTNLTSNLAYDITHNGTTIYTIDAASSQVSWSYATEGIQEFAVTYTTNASGIPIGDDGGGVSVTFAGFSVNITGDRMVCFDPSPSYSTYAIISYNWDFGDGNTSNIESPCHRYEFTEVQKEYQVSLTVMDQYRYSHTTTREITASNWDFYIGIGLILFAIVMFMSRATIEKSVRKAGRRISSSSKKLFR
jgi:hypothetical protein